MDQTAAPESRQRCRHVDQGRGVPPLASRELPAFGFERDRHDQSGPLPWLEFLWELGEIATRGGDIRHRLFGSPGPSGALD
jgi:hypothetical protein